MWLFSRKGPSGFSASSTAEEVTQGIDGTGLTAIVTGASSGIGIETARVLALRGVHVVMAVRNLPAGRDVKEAIVKEIPSAKVDVMELDLSSMASVRKFASEFNSLDLPLNILINNAGVMATPFMLSQDGIELQFATNHLGHFLLTDLLLGTMKSTAQKSNVEGRVVNLSSDGHKLAYQEGIRFDKINDKSGYNSIYAYGQSKLANILHANELTRLLKPLSVGDKSFAPKTVQLSSCPSEGANKHSASLIKETKEEGVKITANSLHPGAIVTNLLRHHSFLNGIVTALGKYVLKNVPQGAATTCYVALHPQVEGVSGKYFGDSNVASPSAHATNVDLAKKLWEFSLSLVYPNPPSLSTPNL